MVDWDGSSTLRWMLALWVGFCHPSNMMGQCHEMISDHDGEMTRVRV